MSVQPDYGRAFALWRNSAPEAWEAYTRHRFVRALGDGSLPRSAFLHYLKQDYVFLVHYSRAWALAVAKSASLAEMKVAATTVDALVHHEMRLHVEVCAAEGITEAQLFEVREAPQNLAYTRYVLDSGYSGGFLDLMAALAPCALGYGEIGLALASEASSDAYRPWIDTYATNRTNRGRGDAISSRQTGRHVGKPLETAGHGRRGATGMGCTRGRSQDRAAEGQAGGWVRGAWSGGARG